MVTRENNEELIKRLLHGADTGLTRRDIAERLRMDLRTVAAYLDKLERQHFLRSEKKGASGRGRPSVIYYPAGKELHFGGIHIAPQLMQLVVKDAGNEVTAVEESPIDLPSESDQSLLNKVVDLVGVHREKRRQPLNAVGVMVAHRRDYWPNCGAIAQALEKRLGIPVFVDIPINCFACSLKLQYGNYDQIVCVHFGGDLELGYFSHGGIHEKSAQFEKEFIHMTMDPMGEECHCGKRGCLVNYVSKAALAGKFNELKNRSDASFLDLMEAESKGDKVARGILAEAEKLVNRALMETARRLHPDLLVVVNRGADTHVGQMRSLVSEKIRLEEGTVFKYYATPETPRNPSGLAAADMARHLNWGRYCDA